MEAERKDLQLKPPPRTSIPIIDSVRPTPLSEPVLSKVIIPDEGYQGRVNKSI